MSDNIEPIDRAALDVLQTAPDSRADIYADGFRGVFAENGVIAATLTRFVITGEPDNPKDRERFAVASFATLRLPLPVLAELGAVAQEMLDRQQAANDAAIQERVKAEVAKKSPPQESDE